MYTHARWECLNSKIQAIRVTINKNHVGFISHTYTRIIRDVIKYETRPKTRMLTKKKLSHNVHLRLRLRALIMCNYEIYVVHVNLVSIMFSHNVRCIRI